AFWWRWGRALEGRDWCDRALVCESDTEAPHARLGALLAAGIMHYTVGDLAVAVSKRVENREQEAYSVSRLGSVAQYQGNHELAQARQREALAIAREL